MKNSLRIRRVPPDGWVCAPCEAVKWYDLEKKVETWTPKAFELVHVGMNATLGIARVWCAWKSLLCSICPSPLSLCHNQNGTAHGTLGQDRFVTPKPAREPTSRLSTTLCVETELRLMKIYPHMTYAHWKLGWGRIK